MMPENPYKSPKAGKSGELTMLRLIAFSVATALSICPQVAHGELTVTEQLIRNEVARLGGDWEVPSKPALVGFNGNKFESRHFEMLTHLPSLKWFSAHECPIDHFALACIAQVRQLERLDFQGCKLESSSLSILRGNRELKQIIFDSINVTDQLITELASLKQLRTVYLNDCKGLTEERLATLKAALPDATVEGWVEPPIKE